MTSLGIGEGRYLNIDYDKVYSIEGIWDLPMIGGEELDVEHYYQSLIGGPKITLNNIDGAFVENGEKIYQLMENFDDNEFQSGSKAELQSYKKLFQTGEISEEQFIEFKNNHKIERKNFLEIQRSQPHHKNYYPAGGLPDDCIYVVRIDALRDFEQLLIDPDKKADKSNSHKERHAQTREQILGAAFAVLGKWPDECCDQKGKPVASKIAHKIEVEAGLFWPDGEPPLSTDKHNRPLTGLDKKSK